MPSCRFPIDGQDPLPKLQSSLGIELRRALMIALAARASMACRDIRFQTPPNAARDCPTKLCPQFASQAAASLGCARVHWGRTSAEEARPVASATPCLLRVLAARAPSAHRDRLVLLPCSGESKSLPCSVHRLSSTSGRSGVRTSLVGPFLFSHRGLFLGCYSGKHTKPMRLSGKGRLLLRWDHPIRCRFLVNRRDL